MVTNGDKGPEFGQPVTLIKLDHCQFEALICLKTSSMETLKLLQKMMRCGVLDDSSTLLH